MFKHKKKALKANEEKRYRPHRATGRPRGRPAKYRKGERHGHHRYYVEHGVLRRHHFKRVWLY